MTITIFNLSRVPISLASKLTLLHKCTYSLLSSHLLLEMSS